MSRWFSVIGVMTCVALGSCVHQAADVSGFAWSFQENPGEGPKLAYGAPASDNVVLMMTCERGAETVNVSMLGASPGGHLTLASGGDRQAFRGEAVPGPGALGMVEAVAPVGAEPLAKFAQTGKLSVIDRGRTAKLDASREDRAGVERFFEACTAEA